MWDNKEPAGNGYADQMRLDAVKAEADRKARQQQGEVGLPSFQEYDATQPLKARLSGDGVYLDEEDAVPYRDNQSVSSAGRAGMGSYTPRRPSQGGYVGGGYVQAPRGTRAVDEYNNLSTLPPQPRRQGSSRTQTTSSSIYPPSAAARSLSPANSHAPSTNTFTAVGPAITTPVPTSADAYYSDPYSPHAYGHVDGGSSE
jgi:hypothetical protein